MRIRLKGIATCLGVAALLLAGGETTAAQSGDGAGDEAGGEAPGAAASAPSDARRNDPDPALLKEVEGYLDSLDTLTAAFTQIDETGETRRGTLSLKRPGRLRFDYTDDTPLLLVSDGDLLTFVDYAVGQVTRWPIEDTVLHILVSDDIDLTDSHTIIDARAEAETGRVHVVAQDPDRPEQGRIIIRFDRSGSGLTLSGWTVVDAQRSLTTVRLDDLRRNVALASDLWDFEDPRTLPSERRRRRR